MISVRDEMLVRNVSAVFAHFGAIQQELTKFLLDRTLSNKGYVYISMTYIQHVG